MLVIDKPAEFGPDNLPVRGQCQLLTTGWRLRYFSKGQEEVLYAGTYDACRQAQIKLSGLTLEEMRQHAAKLSDQFQDTVRMVNPDSK